MKAKITLFLSMCIAASFFSILAYSQEKIVETKYFKSNPDLGGDVVIYSSTKEVTGDEFRTIFEFEAKTGGSYALGLWTSPILYPGGNYSSFDVYVNGTKTSLRNGQLQAGEYNYSAGLTKGIYLVKQVVNGNANVKKVIIN